MKRLGMPKKKKLPPRTYRSGAARLRDIMQATGWHPAKLAREVGLGRDTVHRHLSTDPEVHRIPSEDAQKLYAKAFPNVLPIAIWPNPDRLKARKAARKANKSKAQRDERRA